MKLKEQNNNELFFVEVREPYEVRRHILETLKEIVEVLHRFEKFRHIRHEKIEKLQKLRVMLRDANKMLGTLKMKLPQTSLKAAAMKDESSHHPVVHKKKKKSKAVNVKEEKAPPKKEMTELEKLESQLSAIEGKLKELA